MILTVTSHKGGVAKTTTAMHLGAYLERRDGEGSTVVVDADPNGSALGWARRGRGQLGFSVVSSQEAQERGVGREFANVVVDTQGRPRGEGLRRLVAQCDMLVVPTTPEAGSTETIMQMARDIEELGGPAEYRVLLTIVKWYNRRAAQARRSLEKRGVQLFSSEIRDRAAFATAELRGLPVYEIKGKGARDGWADYEAVGREVTGWGGRGSGRGTGAPPRTMRNSGFWTRWARRGRKRLRTSARSPGWRGRSRAGSCARATGRARAGGTTRGTTCRSPGSSAGRSRRSLT